MEWIDVPQGLCPMQIRTACLRCCLWKELAPPGIDSQDLGSYEIQPPWLMKRKWQLIKVRNKWKWAHRNSRVDDMDSQEAEKTVGAEQRRLVGKYRYASRSRLKTTWLPPTHSKRTRFFSYLKLILLIAGHTGIMECYSDTRIRVIIKERRGIMLPTRGQCSLTPTWKTDENLLRRLPMGAGRLPRSKLYTSKCAAPD